MKIENTAKGNGSQMTIDRCQILLTLTYLTITFRVDNNYLSDSYLILFGIFSYLVVVNIVLPSTYRLLPVRYVTKTGIF